MSHLEINHKFIRKAILKSQHCQRNFDLTREMPEKDVELMKTAISQCPSKQNLAFYKAHFVFEREAIENIHKHTKGFGIESENYQTNSQVLANLLVVFEENSPASMVNSDKEEKSHENNDKKFWRNTQTKALAENQEDEHHLSDLRKDKDQAVGIAAGYLNLTASLLGYATGCCACFDGEAIKSILNLENKPVLLMGIGFRDFSRKRREHHKDKTFIFPSFKKQPVEIRTIGQTSSSSAG